MLSVPSVQLLQVRRQAPPPVRDAADAASAYTVVGRRPGLHPRSRLKVRCSGEADSAGSQSVKRTVKYSIFDTAEVTYDGDKKPVYRDNAFDKFMIGFFANRMAAAAGVPPPKHATYKDLVDISFQVMRRQKTPEAQKNASLGVMLGLMPDREKSARMFKTLFPPTKWSCEVNAWITVPFFGWLVGPCSLGETDVNGVQQKSVVKIERCRYLEESGCTGMCVNMCKSSTQEFFTDTFGLPLTMNPNYEDYSCEMIFGLAPPPIEEDDAVLQPCLKTCATAKLSDSPCHQVPKSTRLAA